MTKIVYTGLLNDELVQIALDYLKQKENVEIHTLDDYGAPYGSNLLFTSNGRFAHKWYRHVKPADREKRNIETPDFGKFAANAYALNIRQRDDMLAKHHYFISALDQLHLSLMPRRITVRSKRIIPREEWTSGFHARIRRTNA